MKALGKLRYATYCPKRFAKKSKRLEARGWLRTEHAREGETAGTFNKLFDTETGVGGRYANRA